MKNTQEKKAVRVGLGLRYQKEEHELYPVYGQYYEQGYLHADRGYEVVWLLTDPVPEGTELTDEEQVLKDLGYEVYELEFVQKHEDSPTEGHYELVVL